MASRVNVLIRSHGQRRECLFREVRGEGEDGGSGEGDGKETARHFSLLDDEAKGSGGVKDGAANKTEQQGGDRTQQNVRVVFSCQQHI